MDEHFIFSRPVVVTEDKLREALAKKANQKTLKDALDQQVFEAERLKVEAHRAKGRKEKKSANRGSLTSAPSSSSEGETARGTNSSLDASPAGPSPAPLVPSPPPSSGTHAGPSSGLEPTRYTFSFKEGQGTFEVTDKTVRQLKETLQPSSAESRARTGSKDDGGPSVPSSNIKEKKPDGPVPVRRTPSSRDSAREAGGGGSSSNRRRRKGSPTAPAAAGRGEYQTNSLPADFRLGKRAGNGGGGGSNVCSPTTVTRERVGSGGSQPSRGASRERGGAGGAGSGDEGGYDTQSLPVELIYKLSQGNALPSAAGAGPDVRSPLSRLKPPHPPRLVSPKRSLSTSRISDSMGMRSPRTPLLPPPGSPGSALRDRAVPVSPRGGKAGRLSTPLDSARGARPSARPAGGILPPLNGRRDSDVIEMSAILDAQTPIRESGAGAGGAPRRRTNSTPKDRALFPPGASPLNDVSASEQARKQAEREKGWAQQVKQLKAELRKARQEAGAKLANNRADEAQGKAPRRAETAPDPPAYPPGKAPRGVGGIRQRRVENGGNRGENALPARPTRLEKVDFSQTRIFNRETFRPITAPEDASSYFGGLLHPPSPRTPLPPVQPKASPALAAVSTEQLTAAKRTAASTAQSDPLPHEAVRQNSVHTVISADDSLKLASLTTRQITLGLPDYGDGAPVPIEFLHLRQFVEAQIITASQAENLWEFFALSVPVEFGGSGGGGGAGQRRFSSDAEHLEVQDEVHAGRGEEMESHTIEVEEVAFAGATHTPHRAEIGGNSAGSEKGEMEEDEPDDFFVPHSPSQLPTNAVLAPALRRKISQLHSEEAAMFLQRQQQLRNGRQRPSLIADRKPKSKPAEKDAGREERAQTSPLRGSSPSLRRDSQGSEPAGTFDTYAELKLPRNVRTGDAGEEEEEL
ncbi:hypothetical protein ABB37_02999 [Leptomonas pyrrhocoris]|uniref:Uncharacterized protein n=1 Tax=Leptomonas pyrrhocoris TaxID=157538 RepID=A0A0M9G6L7_LEPPY|nr:hypothetical protein ABB37_02999 [Leptomonas pyrrhocoris]KPA83346.1 hypothetical protein ABB37_02999 [Leptomonas pyrrhocoris]|eukprot:XP_015661785.1 hypothetical protein ABB37_02999 [Leptomonas pyrrhocoris]